MRNFRNTSLLLAILVCWASRGFATPTALGSVTIGGGEQSSGSTWDTGTVTATVNGVSVSFAYGQFSTPASVAAALGALISNSCNMPVYAQANGTTLTFYKKGSNTIASASITSVSSNPSLFPSNSFLTNGGGSWVSPQISRLSMPEGPPAMGFTISGAGFGYGLGTVTIGGTFANVVLWTPTYIVVQVPAGAVTGNVIVTPAFGFSITGASFKVDTPFQCN